MRLIFVLFIIVFGAISCGNPQFPAGEVDNCNPPSHQLWTEILQAHVDSTGWVSYAEMKADSVKLNSYCRLLSNCSPNPSWSKNEQLAYWINAYNAFTIKLMVDNYPLKSIKDIKNGIPFINSVWDIKFFEIGGKTMDLNAIEHSILRKHFSEPRIHFAIVCASASCPQLLNKAYTAERLETQLESQAFAFINDENRNRISKDELELSSIFKWFTGDFTEDGTLKDFIQKYTPITINADAKVEYLDYNWSLNGE